MLGGMGIFWILSGGWVSPADSFQAVIRIQQWPPFFAPTTLTVRAGSTIRWENDTADVHTLVADECRRRTKCVLESGPIRPQERFVVKALPPGRYPYHCGLHPYMRGILIVDGNLSRPMI